MALNRFVLWAAVSSLPQVEKISLQSQIEQGRAVAARHGGAVVAELVVPGKSRSIVLFEDACKRIDAYAQLADLIVRRRPHGYRGRCRMSTHYGRHIRPSTGFVRYERSTT